jgi:hypothetical protein
MADVNVEMVRGRETDSDASRSPFLKLTVIIQLWANGQFLYATEYYHASHHSPTSQFLLALEALALPSSVAPGALFFLTSCASF